MKKGKKYRETIYKIKTVFHSGYVAAVLGFSALILISLGDIVKSGLSFCPGNDKDYVGLVISILSFIASIIGAARSAVVAGHDCFDRQLLVSKEYKELIKECMNSTYICGFIRLLDRGGNDNFLRLVKECEIVRA